MAGLILAHTHILIHLVILPYSHVDRQKHTREKQKHQHKAQEKNPIKFSKLTIEILYYPRTIVRKTTIYSLANFNKI